MVVLRYTRSWRVLLSLPSIPLFLVAAGGLLGIVGGHEPRQTTVFGSLGLLILAGYALLEVNFVSIAVDQVGLVHRSPWRRRRSIPWREIYGHSRSDFNGWVVIETAQGKLRVSDFMGGAGELIQLVTARIDARSQQLTST